MAAPKAVTYDEVFLRLSESKCKYSTNCSDSRKRAIRKFSKNVALVDGILYYNQRKWISDTKLQQQILKSIHSDSSGGCHFGRDKTREKIAKRYYWHGMYEDIDSFVKTCVDCQRVRKAIIIILNLIHSFFLPKTNPKFTKSFSSLKPIPISSIWDRIGIDLIGPLPATSKGNKLVS